MRIAIVDDEEIERNRLQEYLEKYEEENRVVLNVDNFSSGDQLMKNYRLAYDIILFDVDMPGTNGMETAKRIREVDANVVMLFVTNIAQYAIDGYEVEAVDYILKPIAYYDFSMKFKRAVRRAVQKQEVRVSIIQRSC